MAAAEFKTHFEMRVIYQITRIHVIIYKTNNTQHFVRTSLKLPTLGTFETVKTHSAIASGVLDYSKVPSVGNSY